MNNAALLAELGSNLLSGAVQVIDLSGRLGPETPVLKLPEDFAKNSPKVEIHKISEYDEDGPYFAWNWLVLGEHTGTHFDAPHHWITGRDYDDGYTDTIPPKNFIAPLNVIDCSAEAASDADFLLSAERVQEWEAEQGEINAGEWVVMRTDWHKRAHDETLFLNMDQDGSHYPGPTVDCIEYLLGKGVIGWGSECISTDAGSADTMQPPLPAHTLMHAANRYGLASLANLDQLPAKGALLIAAPLKIANGTGSPIRALALVARA
ncbi:MAG: cyclase family protein [Alphaproteobacteria bacterium]|jgi:kynurenine formamidase|nr:cyclase family protein [Alphaproteobacteria bacterium]